MKKKDKIVCIGNSIVNGFPLKRSQSFTSLLRSEFGFNTINKGVNGDTTGGILSRFDEDVKIHQPVKCLVLTGTNDFIKGGTIEEAAWNLKTLIERREEIDIVLLTPILTYPKMAEKMWIPADYEYINRQLEALGETMKEMEGCQTIDTQIAFEQFASEKGYENVYRDGIHPLEEGHKMLAEYIAKELNGGKR